ncbi:MAG: M81 family metallopeptidase [Lautropia sp.]
MTARATPPRFALVGIHLEANGFAPPTTRADFEAECWEEGERITGQAYATSHLPLEVPGFYRRMDETGPWTPVPLILLAAQPGGPVLQDVFDEFMAIARRRLREALPVDGVYVCSHGGSKATGDDDNDGTLVAMVRELVGSGVPVVVTHDLHCSVSDRMARDADAVVAYLTNPHVDHRERGAEAADLLRLMHAGAKTRKAFIRLPLQPSGVSMLVAEGWPMGDLIRLGQSLRQPPILNVSVTGGFILTDVPKAGITVNVTADGDQAAADRVARRLARAAWDMRHRFIRELTSLARAVELAREAARGDRKPVILADLADNPGGGAPGNTTWLMRALHEAGVPDVVVGLFTDRELAAEAHRVGQGQGFTAVFNRVEGEFNKRFECPAVVEHLSDGNDVGRRGRDAGRQIVLGTSALLRLERSGLRVVVTSLREQPADPRTLEMFGVDIAHAHCLVLKSRGHFRAGFDEFFADDQIFEVDVPGLTSNVLSSFNYRGLPRPIFPLDLDTHWTPPADDVSLAP